MTRKKNLEKLLFRNQSEAYTLHFNSKMTEGYRITKFGAQGTLEAPWRKHEFGAHGSKVRVTG